MILRNARFFFVCVAALLTLSGCTTPLAVSMDKHEQAYAQSAASQDKGIVYFYREKKFAGSARGMYVTADNQRIGALNNGTYFTYEASPGKHVFSVENWMVDDPSRTIDVLAGEKYYLEGSLDMGFWDAVPRIKIISKEEGEEAIRALRYATLKTGSEPVEVPKR